MCAVEAGVLGNFAPRNSKSHFWQETKRERDLSSAPVSSAGGGGAHPVRQVSGDKGPNVLERQVLLR